MNEVPDGSMYRERPSSLGAMTVWTLTAGDSPSWVLPDGCLDVLWDGQELMVAGPDTVAHLATSACGTRFAAVRFASGVGPAVLGVSADSIQDERPLLADVIGADPTDQLIESLVATDDPSRQLEQWAARRLAQSGGPDRTMRHVAAMLEAGRGVADVADAVGFSERQLHRRSLAAFGYGPKMLLRILRVQRALGAARSGSPLVQAALDAGYGDQAHFAHDVRALTGQTASQLVGSAA